MVKKSSVLSLGSAIALATVAVAMVGAVAVVAPLIAALA